AQGAVWALGGGTIVYASGTMDRLERHGAAFFTAPGLVPGLLGLVLLVLGVVLALRNRPVAAASPPFRWGNTPLVLALCLGYAVGLVGRAPFWLATFVFVTAFIAVFEYPARRRMAFAPLYGVATSLAVSYLFESVFLVRLP
ncbi:MAG: tripartite tricarboxylate transporter TctB family protein, partial [Burkholderiales bacterium]